MIPHERAMADRLKNDPFALIGINSDGDRDVSQKLDEKQLTAVRALGGSTDAAIDRIRAGDPEALTGLKDLAAGVRAAILAADQENLGQILAKAKITWRQAAEYTTRGPLATRWNVQGWPTIYVLDAGGVIRFRGLRDEALEEAVVRLIAEAKEGAKR
jgi:hypothetical protein